MSEEDYIEFRIDREDFENHFDFKFCNEKWELFKNETQDTLDENLWEAFQNYDQSIYTDKTNCWEDLEDTEHIKYISDEEFWRYTDKELRRQHKVEQLEEKIPIIFANKIQEFYLKAKYNPRTEIGKKFIYKLYHENFSEEE